jgi:uncharacterized protein
MTRKLMSPVVNSETKAFFDAARQGRFMIPVCTACGKAHWYPRAICPFCSSDNVEWREASGKGAIYTFSVMRRVKEPYVIAHVDCDFDTVRIGQPVTVKFEETEDGPPVPMFKPA